MHRYLKRIVAVFLMIIMFGSIAFSNHYFVKADTKIGVVTTARATSTVNVRSETNTTSTILAELICGTEVTVLESVKASDGTDWYRIECKHPGTGKSLTGYMSAKYVTIKESAPEETEEIVETPESSITKQGEITANNVFVRKSAGTDGEYILSLYRGDLVTIVGQVMVGDVVWYHITGTKSGKSFDGFSHGGYVLVKDTIIKDTDYATKLKNAGFPESYIANLVSIHEKYPKWEFVAVQTGLDWNTVISKESANGVNLVSSSSDDSMKSTAVGAYDWTTNTWKVFDGSSWVGANTNYISYYMDPRNFLDEKNIFQFEALSYSSTQTLAGVQAILSNTFMNGSVKDSDGKTLNYASAFVEIGKTTGVSPYHLAARVVQEQGTKGTSSMISGKYSGYEGYYNYFNYGASGSGTTTVLTSGLSYAKSKGWNTRYKSLLGGATLLGKNYILRGQDTLYFEKFNVVYTAGLYNHQYMGNLLAAYSEGRKMATAYTDKSQAFVFRIPVYKNMPAKAVSFTPTGNPNNYLKSLTISGQSMTPVFSGATVSYSLIVDNSISSIKVSATPVVATSTVSGTGNYTLQVGSNTIQIKCKSQSGVSRTYTIKVNRKEKANEPEGSKEATIKSSKYSVDKYITGVEIGTKAAAFLKNITAENCTVSVLNADGSVNDGVISTGNRLALMSDGVQVKSYEIVIRGDLNGDGKVSAVDMVRLYRYMNSKLKLSGCYLAATDINKDGKFATAQDIVKLNLFFNNKFQITQ